MSKNSKRRLAKVLRYAGATLMGFGFFYILGVAGTSDFESEIGQILHPSSWYWIHGLIGLVLMGIGSFLDEHKRECYWFIVHIVRFFTERKSNEEGEVLHD